MSKANPAKAQPSASPYPAHASVPASRPSAIKALLLRSKMFIAESSNHSRSIRSDMAPPRSAFAFYVMAIDMLLLWSKDDTLFYVVKSLH